MKRIFLSVVAALAVVLLLFDVNINFRFQLPASEEGIDTEQEARYAACLEDFEQEIHAETFERVDNPDVQRELLYRQMQEAKASCRQDFPERTVLVDLPLDINFVDLDWRF